MFLENSEVQRARAFYKILSTFPNNDHFKCIACEGTGLLGVSKVAYQGGKSWNGEYCPACRGVGFLPSWYKDIYFVCPNCEGKGRPTSLGGDCPLCKGFGIVDWIIKMRGMLK